MGLSLHDQTLASTREDSHGEKYSKAFLEDMLATAPLRAPIHQQHDMSLPTLGWINNFRLLPDPDQEGKWRLVGDIHLEGDAPPRDLHGYSWSATRRTSANCEKPRFDLYLPWPHYNDTALNEWLLDQPEDLGVGKWIKKSLRRLPDRIAGRVDPGRRRAGVGRLL